MRRRATRTILSATAAVLVAGAALAARIYSAPTRAQGPDAGQVAALAAAVRDAERASPRPSLDAARLPEPAPPTPDAAPTPRTAATQASARAVKAAPEILKPAREEALPPAAPAPRRATPTRLKNLAMVAVTHSDGWERVRIQNVQSREQEEVGEGESAFGYFVKSVQPEEVVLTQEGREFLLRLGDNALPDAAMAEGPQPAGGAADAGTESP
jgi:hypothetical protein